MGFYDGLGGTTPRAGAWHLADTLRLPVLLVLRPQGASLTLAALVRGLRDFRPDSHLAGLLLNACSPALYASLAPMLEHETGLPVLGYLPSMPEAAVHSRHLGLYTAQEIADLTGRVQALAAQAAKSIDIDRLLRLCTRPERPATEAAPPRRPFARIAVAQDAAFCFCYSETLDALRDAGAEPVPFSPLRDAGLPQGCGGLYLPGGYPELYAAELAENAPMRRAVQAAVRGGIPAVAECGGFLYLSETLQDGQGRAWPMAAVLPGEGYQTGRLVRFGYAQLTARQDGLLLQAGQSVPVHEFHYWDSTCGGQDFEASKPLDGRRWACGFSGKSLFAGFPHLYWAGAPQLARRFAVASGLYAKEHGYDG